MNTNTATFAAKAPYVPSTAMRPTPTPAGPRLTTLAEISTDPAEPLLLEMLDPAGHTILYGTGGVGKGILAADLIGRLVSQLHLRVAIIDFEQNDREWARRIHGLGYGEFNDRILYLAPNAIEWQGHGGPLPTSADEIRLRLDAFGAQYVVIDSLGFAVNGDPSSAEVANAYNRALARLGRPALSLGHVSREANMQYPFGSVFWHNGARMTWAMEARPGGDVALHNQKHNNYPRSNSLLVTTTWADDLDGYGSQRYGIPLKVEITSLSMALNDQIARALSDGPRTLKQIVDALNEDLDETETKKHGVKENSVRKALNRGCERKPGREPRFAKHGDSYQNVSWTLPEPVTEPTPEPENTALWGDEETR